jgi:hypothetical protein
MPGDAPESTTAVRPLPEAASDAHELAAAPPREGVLYRSPLAGPRYVANIAAGVVVCALIGALLGLAIPSWYLPVPGAWVGALFGALVALGGALPGRRRGELVPLAIEVEPAARRVRVVRRSGEDLVLDGGAVDAVRHDAVGDADAERAHWLVFLRGGAEVARVRIPDAAEAARLEGALRAALGLGGEGVSPPT